MRLATSCADAIAELEIAKLEAERRRELADAKVISKRELAIGEIKFRTADRKVAVLRRIAESASMVAKAEMDVAWTQLDRANEKRLDASALEAIQAELIRAESRLTMLESILR